MTEHRIVQTVTEHYGRCSSQSSDGDVQTVVLSSRTQQLLCVFSLAVQKERERKKKEKKARDRWVLFSGHAIARLGRPGGKERPSLQNARCCHVKKKLGRWDPAGPGAERDERFLSVVWAFSDTHAPPPPPLPHRPSPPPPPLPPNPPRPPARFVVLLPL